MADLRRPSLRLAVGVAIVILGVVDVQSLVQTLRAQARLRERATRATRDAVLAARPRLLELMRPGGAEAWLAAAREALGASLAVEFEVFDSSGGRLFSHPAKAAVEHWPAGRDLETVRAGGVVTLGPQAGRAWRLLTYTALRSGEGTVILRLAAPVPELAEDLKERREVLVGHAVSLAALVLAAALVLFPRGETAQPQRHALSAYEQAMAQLRDRDEALVQRIRDKEPLVRAGELTAGMTHEVRNGLGTILGYARLIERASTPEEARDAARAIREECETLEGVVRRFMDFVREDALHLASFDVGRMLSRVAARESRGRPGAEVALALETAGHLQGDEEMLERAFENLIRNALEAAGASGHVRVEAAPEDDATVVTVTDDGPGLPEPERARLRPFTSTKPGGLGLGLPIVLKIVALHRGELLMSDALPRGLSVSVRLPSGGPPP